MIYHHHVGVRVSEQAFVIATSCSKENVRLRYGAAANPVAEAAAAAAAAANAQLQAPGNKWLVFALFSLA